MLTVWESPFLVGDAITIKESQKRILELKKEITEFKQAIINIEPSIQELANFVSLEHPKRLEQYEFETQMREAQAEINDLEDSLLKVAILKTV